MDPTTHTALLGSIDKWTRIVAGTGRDLGSRDCPLCTLFVANCCKDCPVKDKTGVTGCHKSPYYDYLYAQRNFQHIRPDLVTKAAQLELDFLKSLLPTNATSATRPTQTES